MVWSIINWCALPRTLSPSNSEQPPRSERHKNSKPTKKIQNYNNVGQKKCLAWFWNILQSLNCSFSATFFQLHIFDCHILSNYSLMCCMLQKILDTKKLLFINTMISTAYFWWSYSVLLQFYIFYGQEIFGHQKVPCHQHNHSRWMGGGGRIQKVFGPFKLRPNTLCLLFFYVLLKSMLIVSKEISSESSVSHLFLQSLSRNFHQHVFYNNVSSQCD